MPAEPTDDLDELGLASEAEPPSTPRPIYQRVLLALMAAVTIAITAYLLIAVVPVVVLWVVQVLFYRGL